MPGSVSHQDVVFEDLNHYMENSSVSLHIVGADGTILWANETELSFMGYSKEEYFNKSIIDFHEDKNVISDVLERLTKNETLINYPARLKKKNGEIILVSISSNVYRKDGKFIHTRCFTQGITEKVYNAMKEDWTPINS